MSRVARWYSILAFACVTGAHAQEITFTTGARTLQGGQGPEMVVIPAGRFRMGCAISLRVGPQLQRSAVDCPSANNFNNRERPVHQRRNVAPETG